LDIKNNNFGNCTQSGLQITTDDNLRILYEIFVGNLRVRMLKICKDVSSNKEVTGVCHGKRIVNGD
jgi:hypothetical protein